MQQMSCSHIPRHEHRLLTLINSLDTPSRYVSALCLFGSRSRIDSLSTADAQKSPSIVAGITNEKLIDAFYLKSLIENQGSRCCGCVEYACWSEYESPD